MHCDYYWITDGIGPDEEVVGFLALRHSLTAWLLEEGGHIGYSVRPSRRARGARLAGARARAYAASAELGLDRVLLTCDDDNLASARTIERNERGLRGHPQRQAPLLDRHLGLGPGSVVHELRTEEPQHPHEVVGVDHRRVDGEGGHAAAREEHLPAAMAGLTVHLEPRVLARQVEDEPAALLDRPEADPGAPPAS